MENFLLRDESPGFASQVLEWLRAAGVPSFREYEIELLVRRKSHLTPLIIHGVDWEKGKAPPYLADRIQDMSGVALGVDMAHKLKARLGDQLQIISPAHLDPILGGLPRTVSEELRDVLSTDVPEADLYHGWVRAGLIHNLLQEPRYNKVRHYGEASQVVEKIVGAYGSKVQYRSWEEINQTLVQALRLESTIMTVLFVAMTLLVAISISSGLFIFYQKIHREMIGLWIMGMSERKLRRASGLFVHLLALLTCGAALLGGLAFLTILDHWSPGGDAGGVRGS